MMDSLPFSKKGYTLTRTDDIDFVLRYMKKTILESVTETEKVLSDLWIGNILSVLSAIFENKEMDNEAFILEDENSECGLLWMGKSKDQFTCEETGYLLGICVRENLRGQGLGKALMGSAESWCRSNGLITLTLNVGAPNKTANALYRMMGYEPQTTVMRKLLV